MMFGSEPRLLPKFVQQNDNVIFTRNTLFREKVAAIAKRRPHHAIHAGGCFLSGQVLRLILRCKVEAAAGKSVQILKDGVLILPVKIILGRDPVTTSLNFGPHHDKLLGLEGTALARAAWHRRR